MTNIIIGVAVFILLGFIWFFKFLITEMFKDDPRNR